LQEGRWFKLICGASYQHLPSIQNLALAYALAGADCIDVAADPAVVEAVKAAFQVISRLLQTPEFSLHSGYSLPAELPWLMVSFSDGEDPHFRKAVFDPMHCPVDCSRPCEAICPAAAIAFNDLHSGVIAERCYGCGRCLPVCPIQQIETVTRATSVAAIAPTLFQQVDAIEIHTQVGRYDAFMELWSVFRPHLSQLSLVSISCPDHERAIDYLWQLYEGMQPCSLPLIWQTDGRPMSGDIGKGTTHATLRYAQKVLQSGPPGFVQLAGGTNAHTVTKLRQLMPFTAASTSWSSLPCSEQAGNSQTTFGGIAYGSFARRLLQPVLEDMPTALQSVPAFAVDAPLPLNVDEATCHEIPDRKIIPALELAYSLVAPLKAAPSGSFNSPLAGRGRLCSSMEALQESPSYPSSFE
jgi:Fe-S-cluster-containing hydrogenase component 2